MTFRASASPTRLRQARALLLGTAFAALASTGAGATTLSVTGIATPPGAPYGLTLPSIEVVDGNLDEGALRGLFTGAPGSPDALSTLDARAVRIPELSFTSPGMDASGTPTTMVYRGLVLEDVTDGVAASVKVESAEITGADGLTGSFGAMSADGFNLGALLGFYGLGAGAGDTAMKSVYSDFRFAGGKVATAEFSCDIGAATAGGFEARPLKQNITDVSAAILELDAAEKSGATPDPESVGKVIRFYTDMLTAFSTSPMQIDGFSCAGKDDKGNPMTIASGPITAGGFKPAVYPEFSLSNFRLDVENDGWMKFGKFTWKQMDFSAAIAALETATSYDEAYFTANWRKLVPVIDGFALSDFSIDIPDEEKAGQRIAASLGAFDATFGNYVNGIPADIGLSLSNLKLPITPEMTDLPVADLLARGIKELDLSLGTRLAWDQAASTIEVSEVLIDLGQLGKVLLSGTFGNATDTLFSDDPDQALVAAQLITLKRLTVEVEDRGIASLMFAAGAREAGQPEPTFRTALSGMAQGMTLAFLGNTAEALTAAQQLGAFLGGKPNLKLTITSKDEAGIGLAELAALEKDPTALAGRITVAAEASGEPLPPPALVETPAEPAAVPAPDEAPASSQDKKRDLKAPAAGQ